MNVVVCDVMFYVLCSYLYDLVSYFMSFYEVCLVLKSDVFEVIWNSCLVLLVLVVKEFKLGFELLGIEMLEKM